MDILSNLRENLTVASNLIYICLTTNRHHLSMKTSKQIYSTKMVIVFLGIFFITLAGQAQNKLIISGLVTDIDSGSLLPGVNVLVKNTQRGTMTNFDGKYTIGASVGEVLVFSYLGFKTLEIVVDEKTNVDVTLVINNEQLDEVVITALGIKKEVKSLGYSVTEFKGDKMVKARETNPISTLTGKVAGLDIRTPTDFFSDPQITMRGGTPLIVIDGVPNPNADFYEISPDDIDNISVLKGATASALYGSLGRSGALLITTKRGKDGMVVEFNSSTQLQNGFLRAPKIQTVYGTGDAGEYAYVDGFEYSGYVWGPRLDQPADTESGFFETTQYNSPIDPVTGQRIPTPFVSKGKNNIDNFLRTGILQSNNLSVTGGNEDGNFRVSASNTHQKAQVPNMDLNIYSFGVSGGYNISEKLTVDASINYSRQESDNYPNLGYGSQSYLYSIMWLGANVDLREMRNYWEEGREGFQQLQYNKQWFNNPWFMAHEYNQGWYRNTTLGQANLNYKIADELMFNVKAGFSNYGLRTNQKEPLSYIRGFNDYSDGNYFVNNESNFNFNTDAVLTYTKRFNENFALTSNAGGAVRTAQYLQSSINTDGLIVPNFYNIANSLNPVTGNNRETREKVVSAYATVDLEMYDWLYLGFTGRNDWVSTLPVDNNSFFYPSVSSSLLVSELFELPDQISFLKLRSSWSRVSDGSIPNTGGLSNRPYNHINAYNEGSSWNNVNSVDFPSVQINPDLIPATSDTWEIGLDARFLRGRLSLDVAYYNIVDFNNLILVPVSQASGFSSRLENAGKFRRRGIELLVSAKPIVTEDFLWNISTNWTQYRRYLEESPDGTGEFNNIKEGHRMDEIWANVFQKTPGGQNIIQNGTRVVDPFVRNIGYNDADWSFGIQNTFKYKDFTLSISGDGRIGGLISSITNFEMHWAGTHPNTVRPERDDANAGIASYVDPGVVVVQGNATFDTNGTIINDTRVYAPNSAPVNYISWAKDNYQKNEAGEDFYFDETFFKIREIILTWQIPKGLIEKTFLNKASVSVVGRNLFLFTSVPQIDPDQGYDDQFQSPSSRSFGFNINLNF
jgi:TonB-linked SusC/RagA family outer membrane protein